MLCKFGCDVRGHWNRASNKTCHSTYQPDYLPPPWKQTVVLHQIHARNFQGNNFHHRKSPCRTHIADPGLVSWEILNKTIRCARMNAQNCQECCFYEGKSPCGMQHAIQELVNYNSSRFQSQFHKILYKSDPKSYKSGVIRGPQGVNKNPKFFSKGVVAWQIKRLSCSTCLNSKTVKHTTIRIGWLTPIIE